MRGKITNLIEKFRIETLEAYEEYKRTGEYITQEDAIAWIQSLIASPYKEAPQLPSRRGRAVAP
jgi:predicted transcriptional regulator